MRQLSASGLNLSDKRVDPGYWVRSGFKSPWKRLVVSLFRDSISYERFTGATLYAPCLDCRANKLYPFFHFPFPYLLPWWWEYNFIQPWFSFSRTRLKSMTHSTLRRETNLPNLPNPLLTCTPMLPYSQTNAVRLFFSIISLYLILEGILWVILVLEWTQDQRNLEWSDEYRECGISQVVCRLTCVWETPVEQAMWDFILFYFLFLCKFV